MVSQPTAIPDLIEEAAAKASAPSSRTVHYRVRSRRNRANAEDLPACPSRCTRARLSSPRSKRSSTTRTSPSFRSIRRLAGIPWARGKIPVLSRWRPGPSPNSSVICTYMERVGASPAGISAETRDFRAGAMAGGVCRRHRVPRPWSMACSSKKVIRPNIVKQPTDPAAIAAIVDGACQEVLGYLERIAVAKRQQPGGRRIRHRRYRGAV